MRSFCASFNATMCQCIVNNSYFSILLAHSTNLTLKNTAWNHFRFIDRTSSKKNEIISSETFVWCAKALATFWKIKSRGNVKRLNQIYSHFMCDDFFPSVIWTIFIGNKSNRRLDGRVFRLSLTSWIYFSKCNRFWCDNGINFHVDKSIRCGKIANVWTRTAREFHFHFQTHRMESNNNFILCFFSSLALHWNDQFFHHFIRCRKFDLKFRWFLLLQTNEQKKNVNQKTRKWERKMN